MDEREQVRFNLPLSLAGKKIHWIREFKFLSGARLRAAKAMYELLEARGYVISDYRSLVYANRLWQHWVVEADDLVAVEDSVISAAKIVGSFYADRRAHGMAFGELPE